MREPSPGDNPPRHKNMAKYDKFEDLPAWQEAARLYNQVLDLLRGKGVPFTPGFRNQLDRASLSVSNNIAEGFERVTTNELLSFLGIARGSSGEVRSMIAVVKNRPELQPFFLELQQIRETAKSCSKQITAWTGSLEDSRVTGKRHLSARDRESRRVAQAAREFRLNFLRNLKTTHPLYNSPEAKEARGERME
jgi:four helix bundle protein